MAKAPPSYAALELTPTASPPKTETPAEALPEPLPEPSGARRGRPTTGHTLKEVSAPVMLYLDPKALKALKRYALDQNTKVHSLLLEAVEAWFKSHGLRETVRARTSKNSD